MKMITIMVIIVKLDPLAVIVAAGAPRGPYLNASLAQAVKIL